MSRQQIIDLLAMSRFANLPTVWSNGFLGALVGWGLFNNSALISPLALVGITLALSALYLGGCFYNDWHDVDFDQATRPDRPIPAGRWSRKSVFALALSLMSSGLLLATLVSLASGLFAGGIILCILAYTRWHKSHAVSFLFMAGARALIYPMAAFSLLSWDAFAQKGGPFTPIFILLGLGLGSYILGISLTARSETSKDPKSELRKNLPVVCLCLPAFLFSGLILFARQGSLIAALPPLILFIIVLAIIVRRLRATHDVGAFVSRALAAIPLVDFLVVFVIAPDTWNLLVCPLCCLAALGLQKIAPAT